MPTDRISSSRLGSVLGSNFNHESRAGNVSKSRNTVSALAVS